MAPFPVAVWGDRLANAFARDAGGEEGIECDGVEKDCHMLLLVELAVALHDLDREASLFIRDRDAQGAKHADHLHGIVSLHTAEGFDCFFYLFRVVLDELLHSLFHGGVCEIVVHEDMLVLGSQVGPGTLVDAHTFPGWEDRATFEGDRGELLFAPFHVEGKEYDVLATAADLPQDLVVLGAITQDNELAVAQGLDHVPRLPVREILAQFHLLSRIHLHSPHLVGNPRKHVAGIGHEQAGYKL